MDPLSAFASVLAVIEAAVAVAKGIQGLRALKHLPKDFAQLLEEVRDLQYQLEHCKDALAKDKRPEEQREYDVQFVELGRMAKDKLERLARELPSGETPDGLAPIRKLQAYWAGMVDGKSRLRRSRDELRDVRLGLVQAFASLTAPIVVGIDAKVDEIAGVQRDIQLAQQQILNTVIAISQQARQAGLQRPPSYESTVTQTTTVSVNWNNGVSNMTRKKPGQGARITGRANGILDVQIPQDRFARFCLPWCSCQCHTPTYMSSYDALRDIFGCLRVSHSGVPGLAKSCNETQCRRRMSPRVTMRYRLPRAIASFQYLTCSFSTLAGVELRVKLPRVVHWSSPIWGYATAGNFQAVANLFRNGLASPWDVSPLGGNLLHYATDHWNAGLCKLLLDADLDCEAEDDFKNTAVGIAWERVLSGQMSADDACTVASLFEDTDYLSSRGFSVVHKIVLGLVCKDLELELACSTATINTPDNRGRTPLAWAAMRGDEHTVRTLLKYGASVSLADVQGFQPLHLARNTACAELLLDAGANVHARTAEGRTPLFLACRTVQSASLTRLLLDAGADVNAADSAGETPLHNTVTGPWMPFVAVLLAHGADVNRRNGINADGDSPLAFAVMYNRHDMLRRILASEQGKTADFGIVNSWNQSFAHSIARAADVETVRILIDARPPSLASVDLGLRDKSNKTAEEYFRERIEFMEPDEEGHLTAAFATLVSSLSGAEIKFEKSEVFAEQVAVVAESIEKLDIALRVTEVEDEGLPGLDDEVFHDAVEIH